MGRLKFTDQNGETKPTERGILDVKVEGGKLVGLGSACPYYEWDYLGSRCDTYYGEALAIVRAGEKGELLLTAGNDRVSAQTTVSIISD